LTVSRDDVDATYAKFRSMTLDKRREIPGLEPERADVIVAGAAILVQLLSFVDAAEFRVSTRGLRYGLLAEYARAKQ
jgi:exopolyphosphatase/guanosine-5'-triphosphate,3'-diphosphate pyrophosphatase